ncbi:hypothetical protein D3C85_550370 [compost metagenome]
MDTSAARRRDGGDHIDVAGTAFHALLVLDPAQDADLVAKLGGTFEVQTLRRLLHAGGELLGQRIAAALEEHYRVAYVLGVLGRIHQTDAGPLAALDLVLQARPRAVLVVAVLALADQEGLLQQIEALADGARAGIGAEVAALLLLGPTMDAQARKVAVTEMHIGVGLIVPQQDVVGRPPFLDQRLLQKQRLGFVGGDGRFDLGDLAHQRGSLGCQAGFAEVAGQTLLEVLGLPYIKQFAAGIEHPVDTRTSAAGGEESTGIEGVGHLS